MIVRWWRLLSLVAVLVAFPAGVPAEEASPPPWRGLTLPLTAEDQTMSYLPFLEEIADTGANAVSLLIPWYQKNHRSIVIYTIDGRTPHEEVVRETLRQARELGLQTMLLPIVLLEEDTPGEWRGSLDPENVEGWYRSYGDTLMELAHLAGEEGVALLSVGSELASMERHEYQWRELCREVRDVFPGEILYTANWDTPHRIRWWDAVDYMGLSTYYELASEDESATTATLTQAAVEWKDWVLDVRGRQAPGMQIILSEAGFPSIDGGTVYPWDYTRRTPPNWEEQRRGYEAIVRAWNGEAALEGCFFYAWIEFKGEPARDYSPRGKPAEEIIRGWYGGGLP